MSWQEHIGKNLIKNVEVTIGDNKTKVDNIDGKLKVEPIRICVYIQNDSEISEPYIEYKYVKSQIDVCYLDKNKKTFNFLNKEMSKD